MEVCNSNKSSRHPRRNASQFQRTASGRCCRPDQKTAAVLVTGEAIPYPPCHRHRRLNYRDSEAAVQSGQNQWRLRRVLYSKDGTQLYFSQDNGES